MKRCGGNFRGRIVKWSCNKEFSKKISIVTTPRQSRKHCNRSYRNSRNGRTRFSKPSPAITARSLRDFRYLKTEVWRYTSRIRIPLSRKVRMSATTICCGGSFQKAGGYLTMAQTRSAPSPTVSTVCRERFLVTKHRRSCSTVISTAFTPLDHNLII